MPELPEVETMVRGVRASLENHKILQISQCPCDCKPITISPDFKDFAARCQGQIIEGVNRIGKRILLELNNTDTIVIEPRMTGLMLIADPPDESHLRLEWRLSQGRKRSKVWFWDRRGLGTIRLFTAAERAEHLGPNKLGPDALQMTEADWQSLSAGTKRPIKVALLEQKFVAGIGNIYASEILHLANVSPQTPANQLSDTQLTHIATATQEVLQTAIQYEGSTLGDGTYRNALNQEGGYQNEHRVYAKAGELCPTCEKTNIERIVQVQRSTFYCPACQSYP